MQALIESTIYQRFGDSLFLRKGQPPTLETLVPGLVFIDSLLVKIIYVFKCTVQCTIQYTVYHSVLCRLQCQVRSSIYFDLQVLSILQPSVQYNILYSVQYNVQYSVKYSVQVSVQNGVQLSVQYMYVVICYIQWKALFTGDTKGSIPQCLNQLSSVIWTPRYSLFYSKMNSIVYRTLYGALCTVLCPVFRTCM